MKKFFLMLLAGVMFIWSGSVLAYTIDDTVNVGKGTTHKSESDPLSWPDYIGAHFDTKGIDVNMTGSNIIITMYTNFDGLYTTYSGDNFYAADLGLDLNLDGTYEYGVKLTHTGPNDGDYSAALYKDGTWESSYDVWEGNTTANMEYGEFYPDDGNHKAWVKMEGGTEKGNVTINISSSPSGLWEWEWTLTIDKNLFDSGDLDNQMGIFWATGTCANDVVEGAVVPIPTTILLLSSGLLGFGLLSRRKN